MEIYRIAEVAALLKCSRGVVRSLIEDGRLEATDLASPKSTHRNYRISQQQIDKYLSTPAPTRSQEKKAQAARALPRKIHMQLGTGKHVRNADLPANAS